MLLSLSVPAFCLVLCIPCPWTWKSIASRNGQITYFGTRIAVLKSGACGFTITGKLLSGSQEISTGFCGWRQPDKNRFLKRILFVTYALPLWRGRNWECTAPIKASPAQRWAGTASDREPGWARGQSWGGPSALQGRQRAPGHQGCRAAQNAITVSCLVLASPVQGLCLFTLKKKKTEGRAHQCV